MEYKIRCELAGHSKDIRCLSVNEHKKDTEELATGSRDKLAKVWTLCDLSSECSFTTEEHNGYVSSVTWITTEASNLMATACIDGHVRIFDPVSKKLLSKIEAHSTNVSCITFSAVSNVLITGSWDSTAKVWQDEKCLHVLKGHDAAVWCVAVIEDEAAFHTITGSADKQIRLWNKDCSVQTYEGHTDAVRSLLVLNAKEFLSASNDASIRHWSIRGDCLATYYSHENYVYSLARLPDGFASCGEDKTLRVWQFGNLQQLRDAECIQTIYHPATSVWAVASFPNGDLVTGSSDGIARVFSRVASRQAPEDVQMAFKDEVASVQVSAKQELGGIPVDQLPGQESLFEPGRTDGQTKMVREGKEVNCYSWSASKQEWEKIGTVVGANDPAGGKGKTSYLGKEYDYVFNVDIQEGMPPIKLPFNEGDDPYMAAQAFITEHELSQYYLDEVAGFIIKNTNWNATKTQSSTPGAYFDPFTGANRYVPTGASATTKNVGSGGDPFTGSGAYVSQTARTEMKFTSKYFPQTGTIRLEQENVKGIVGKLTEFNSKVDSGLAVTTDALQSIEGLMLGRSETNAEHLLTVLAPMIHWPDEFIFPVLDLIRLAVLKEAFVEKIVAALSPSGVLEIIRKYFNSTAGVVNAMLSGRIVANLLTTKAGERLILPEAENIVLSLVDVSEGYRSANQKQVKQLQIALATVLLNLVVLCLQYGNMDVCNSLLALGRSLLQNSDDGEAKFRVLVALGTLVQKDNLKVVASTLEFGHLVRKLKEESEPEKLGKCAKDFSDVLGLN